MLISHCTFTPILSKLFSSNQIETIANISFPIQRSNSIIFTSNQNESTFQFQRSIRLKIKFKTKTQNLKKFFSEEKKIFFFSPKSSLFPFFFSPYTDKMLTMLRWTNEFCQSKSDRFFSDDLTKSLLFFDDNYFIFISTVSSISLIKSTPLSSNDDEPTTNISHWLRLSSISSHVDSFDHRCHIFLQCFSPYHRSSSFVTAESFLITTTSVTRFYFAYKIQSIVSFP